MPRFPFIQSEIIQKQPPIALRAIKIVDGLLAGHHQSPHQGQSIEFNQHKEYTPGDEIRHIDWKLFGKSDRYYIKQFEDETNLRANILLDCSSSMFYPSPAPVGRETKWEYACVTALSLAYLLFRQRDSVGCVRFSEDLEILSPIQSKSSKLIPLASSLEETLPQGKTNFLRCFQHLAETASRKKVLFIFSDFFGEVDAFFPILQQLSHRGEDVVLFHVLDPEELEFPFQDQTLFEDIENPSSQLSIHANEIRSAYLHEMEIFLASVQKHCLLAGIEYHLLRTDRPIADVVGHFLIQRARKKRGRS